MVKRGPQLVQLMNGYPNRRSPGSRSSLRQSGHRLSPHYKDHFEKWAQVDYFPFPFSDERIEECKESELRIVPG